MTCNEGIITIQSWSKPKFDAPMGPRNLRCNNTAVSAGSVGVAYEVNASQVDLVSFEVALASDERRRPFLHFTARSEVGLASIPGLSPGLRYAIEARAHLRGH